MVLVRGHQGTFPAPTHARTNMAQSRHWRQRFDPNADFVFRRSVLFNGERVQIGQPVDKTALGVRHRLRLWWEARIVELAPAARPTGSVTPRGGPWFDVVLPDGSKQTVRGKAAAEALVSGK